ncbi:J domain-containing protein [Rubrivirga sp. S365]|uniref:J domain-containing protein n=1 Tax=Rubrivirga litoralis TaxID=3075598 RepID=A0ABU3BU11_9BACT|nr:MULTISPECIES: J domain-containing protein [unclassified Rubrivirga]MDT0632767.1 J domain-containing protein [Rubrivirga sp. F394]MDT7855193.1 J domain-containing protein [Rubrivirga sp. S365]
MPAPDYYAVLGVDEDASAKEVKKAYRKLAQQYHPDRNAGDAAAEERFKEVQEAYDTLGDEAKRKTYDRARRDPYGGRFEGNPFEGFAGAPGGDGRYYRTPDGTYVRVDATGAGPGSFGGSQDDFVFSGGGGLGGIFDQFFGGGGGGEPQYRGGRDVNASLRLSFGEALAGGPREFRTPTGDTVRITVPKGVRDGFKIKLSGRGEAAPGGRGEPGDLFVTFQVAPSARFSRDGDDLTTSVSVTAVEALLGTTREVETATGKTVRLTIKPGTQPGARLRVRGQGVASDRGTGDLYVEVGVTVPTLSPEAIDGLRAWAETEGLA